MASPSPTSTLHQPSSTFALAQIAGERMHYNVMMEGRGILLPFEGNEDPVIGFHTTRKVWARDAREAAAKAEERVLAEWRQGGAYAHGGVPRMTTLEVWPLGWWRGLITRARLGYAFYRYDD